MFGSEGSNHNRRDLSGIRSNCVSSTVSSFEEIQPRSMEFDYEPGISLGKAQAYPYLEKAQTSRGTDI